MASETVATKRARKPKARKFYRVGPDSRLTGPIGFGLQNQEVLAQGRQILTPSPGGRGFRPYPETPRLLIDKRRGRAPFDLESCNAYWLISDRTKKVFEAADAEAFGYVRCDVQFADGTVGPEYWLCDVLRILDAVDETKSRLKIYEDQAGKVYSLMGGASIAFKADVVRLAHIFRPVHYEVATFCDQQFKDACKAAGLKGIAFKEAAEL